MRARVAELEAERVHAAGTANSRGRHRWRSIASAILLTLSCVLAPVTIAAVWASTQVSDTDRYVETVSPLIDEPSVQADLTDAVTEVIFTHVDLEAVTDEALGAVSDLGLAPRAQAALQALQQPLISGIEDFVHTRVAGLISSQQFATVWDQANEIAHTQLLNLLEGTQGGAISAQSDTITVNLGPIVAQVKERLIADGFDLASNIPEVDVSYELVESDAVTQAQTAYRLLTALSIWLPIITLILFVAGVLLARYRSRAVMFGALGILASMLALGIALAVARIVYLQALPGTVLSSESAGMVYDTLVRFLRDGLRLVAVLALVVAIAAYFSGSSPSAVRARAAASRGIARLRGRAEGAGMRTGGFGVWVYKYKRLLWVATVIIGGLVLVFWSRPTIAVVITTTIVVIVVIALIEFLARPPSVPLVEPAEDERLLQQR
ncbi:hypothetical protein [Diaminobutyricimonas sp. LJ205]|uniref:hypothetical protein n=1 Tax=Diaminobutyricimonas sp. LJ205 TaxID=2683590 RepID=UPI0012F4F17F|nr:hypothetical protein [Diaminobutyricimonas sp. LJ205]